MAYKRFFAMIITSVAVMFLLKYTTLMRLNIPLSVKHVPMVIMMGFDESVFKDIDTQGDLMNAADRL